MLGRYGEGVTGTRFAALSFTLKSSGVELGGPVAHHRGLVITLVVAVVVAVVGIGVMALATNDTDEFVGDDIAAVSGSALLAEPNALLGGSAGRGDIWSLGNSYTNLAAIIVDEFQIRPNDCGATVRSWTATSPGGRRL